MAGRENRSHLWRRFVVAAVLAHVGFGVLRLPHAAYAKRIDRVQEFERLGAIGYHVGRSWPEAAAALDWLVQNTDPNCVLLYDGAWKGALEFAPAILYPRLLYAASQLAPPATRVDGRPIAHGVAPNGERGTLVLVGNGMHLEVTAR